MPAGDGALIIQRAPLALCMYMWPSEFRVGKIKQTTTKFVDTKFIFPSKGPTLCSGTRQDTQSQ